MTQTTIGAAGADSVTILDRAGQAHEITMDGVRQLASGAPPFGAGRVWAEVDDRFVPAVDLIVPLTTFRTTCSG